MDHVVEEKEYINDLLNRGYQPTWDEKSGKRIYVPDPSVYNYRKVVFGDDEVSKIKLFFQIQLIYLNIFKKSLISPYLPIV